MSASKQPRPTTDQQRRLAELRERQARFALLNQQQQQHSVQRPGHGHRAHRGK
jgi:hypothetical protein